MKQRNHKIAKALLIASALTCSFASKSKEVVSQASTKHTQPVVKSVSCNQKFSDFTISGSRLYSKAVFASLLEEFQGQCAGRDLEEKIFHKINAFYQKEGYIYSFVSKVHFVQNKLNITVLEGHIRDVFYDERFENSQVKEYINKLKEIKPYNVKKAARYVALLQKSPGIIGKLKLTPEIIPFSEVNHKDPATVDVVIDNYFYRVFGSLSLDNRYKDLRSGVGIDVSTSRLYTRYRGPNFARLAFDINNPFSFGGRLSTSLLTSGSHEDNTLCLGYSQPVNSYGTNIITSFSTRQIKHPLKQTLNSGEVGVTHPIYLSLTQALDFSLRVNQYGLKNQYQLSRAMESYSVRKLILGLDYKFEDKLKGLHKYSIDYHQSIKTDQNKSVSSKHDKDFRKWIADGNITYPLFCKGCSISLFAAGQYSKNDLFKTEVFSVDLYKGARGFDDSEVYGDKGLSMALELSKFTAIEDHMLFRGFRLYTYLDKSRFWNKIESSYKPKSSQILSYGVGTDIYLADNISFNIEYSKPISKTVNATQFKYDKKPSSRIYLGVRYEFGF